MEGVWALMFAIKKLPYLILLLLKELLFGDFANPTTYGH
jgi:hypothetical protein